MTKNKNLSILYVTTSFPRFKNDYAGSFVYRFAKYLIESGVKVSVIAPDDRKANVDGKLDGVDVKRFRYFYPKSKQCLCYDGGGIFANLRTSLMAKVQLPFFFFGLVLAVFREYKKHDVIHCHWLPTVWAVIAVSVFRKRKKPIVFTNWGSDTRLLPLWLTKWTLSYVDVCVSTAVETDEHLRLAGVTDFKQIMAPIDEEKFNPYSVNSKVFSKELQSSDPIISFVGRLNYFKDPLTFIAACNELKLAGYEFVAVLAGDGDLRQECEAMINDNDLLGQVFLLGNRQDTENIFASSTLTVHISPIENTWANSIAEAMYIGCPVILSDSGYTTKTFTDRVDCLLVKPSDPKLLANSIIELINSEELQGQLISGSSQLLIAKRKDKHSIVSALVACYEEVLA